MAIRSLKGFQSVKTAAEELRRVHAESYKVALLDSTDVHIYGPNTDIVFPGTYTLRTYQQNAHDAFFKSHKRFFYLAWARRLGKEFTCFSLAVKLCILYRHYRAVFVYPTYTQGVDILWDGTFNVGKDRFPIRNLIPEKIRRQCKFDNVKKRILFPNGSAIVIAGSDDIDSLRGKNYSMYVISEHAFQRSDLLDVILPIVSNLGELGTLIIQTTWDGKNHSWRKFQDIKDNPNWFADLQTVETAVDENGIRYISAEKAETFRALYSSEHKFRQEMYMDVSGNTDEYYFANEFLQIRKDQRLVNFDDLVQRDREVYAFWDLGARDANVILVVQFLKEYILILKVFYNTGKTHQFHIRQLYEWAEENKLAVGMNYLPHDSNNISAYVPGEDALSLLTYIRNVLKIDARPVPRPNNKNVAIQYARTLLSKVVIEPNLCKKFLDDLQDYKKEWDERTETFKEARANHHASHTVDAFQTLSIAYLNRLLPNEAYPLFPVPYSEAPI